MGSSLCGLLVCLLAADTLLLQMRVDPLGFEVEVCAKTPRDYLALAIVPAMWAAQA